MVDMQHSKCCGLTAVWVQVPPPAQAKLVGGLERRSDVLLASKTASRGRENLRAMASKLFVTKFHLQHNID